MAHSSENSNDEYEKLDDRSSTTGTPKDWTKLSGGESSNDDTHSNTTSGPNSGASSDQDRNADDAPDTEEQETLNVTANDHDSGKQQHNVLQRMSEISREAPKTKKDFCAKTFQVFSKVEQIKSSYAKDNLLIPSLFCRDQAQSAKLARCAKEYTNELYAYLDQLVKEKKKQKEYKRIHDILIIWLLCEILYFTGQPQDYIQGEICDWFNTHFPLNPHTVDTGKSEAEKDDGEPVDVSVPQDGSEDDGDFEFVNVDQGIPQSNFTLLRRLLLRGNTNEAIHLIEAFIDTLSPLHQAFLNEIIQLAQDLPPRNYGPPEKECAAVWHNWALQSKAACERFLRTSPSDGEDKQIHQEIDTLFKIMAGNRDVIDKAGSALESFVGSAIFQLPLCSRQEANTLVNLLGHYKNETPVAVACLFMILKDWDSAFSAYDDYWLQTHLDHLFFAIGLKNDSSPEKPPSENQVHAMCLEPIHHVTYAYAVAIVKDFDMWDEAIAYISTTKANKEIWLKELFNTVPLEKKSTDALEHILACCEKHKLYSSQQAIHKILAPKYEAAGSTYNAVISYAKAGDIASLDKMADNVLNEYLEKGSLHDPAEESLDFGEVVASSKHFAFLMQYKQMRASLQHKDLKKSSKLVKALLQSLDAPNGFEVILLVDSLPILEAPNGIAYFDEEEMYILIRCFQRAVKKESKHLELFGKYYNRIVSGSTMTSEDVISKLRERLSHNLAIAMIA